MLLAGCSALLSMSAGSATASEATVKTQAEEKPPAPTKPPLRWTGWYGGVNSGYTWGKNNADLSFAQGGGGPDNFELPRSTELRSSGFVGGAQAGYNYQLGRIVFGPEIDLSSLGRSISASARGVDGIGEPFTVSDSQQLDWLGTSRLRLGYAPIEQFLVYGTAGVAYGHVSESTRATAPGVTISFPGFIPVPPLFPLDNPGSNSGTKVGPAFGGGAEYALSDHLSAKIEYLHYDLGDIVVSGVPMGFSVFHLNTRSDMDGQMVRAGLNYRFDALPGSLMSWMPPQVPTFLESLRTEFGTRYWVSNGKTEKYLYNPTGSHLNSQLTYDNLKAYPTELFARTDHTSGIFLKGNIGIGPLTSGSLKDEDFPPVVSSYSSTVSEQKDGSITYGAVDMGYDFLRKQNYKLGAFVGYSYYHETVNADGCLQIATGSDCISPIPEAVRGITNDGEWQSARVGLNGQIMPTQKLKLTADMAWLPYTSLSSYDTHWLRINSAGGFTGPIPDDGTGHGGYQLESILSCQVTPSLSLGVGGRYWHMETSGESNFEGNTVGGGGKPQPVNFSTDRYGAFVQAAFTF